ncbi:hypothetical protein CIL03_12305 [Virgibacillus indicus]|uniref:Uncharacterized protein n=1 Tax=Virgibacillus indicus TaxID=2024554 RepID=A0A265N8T3_9BACI|nr:AimR family lysis-lysogeny pheromone receptor [Virgibacillus indicus]OZU88422.1 hypothetical protein CIL03_12305 [Virgibacillus indicus]
MQQPTIFLSGTDNLTLEQLMELLSQKYDEETVIDLMRKYCMQSSSSDIQKKGMEFLYMYGFYDDLNQLIQKNNESKYPSNRKWAVVYQTIIDRRLHRIKPPQLIENLNNLITEEPELKCLIEFVKVTAHYDLKQYNRIGNFLEIQQHLFELIGDNLLKIYFTIRLNQILMSYHLTRNELIIARKYAYRVLNQTNNVRSQISTHISLGLSYTFDTFPQGIYHLNKALQLARSHNLPNSVRIIEQHNIPFLAAHFNNAEKILTTDKSEQAHIEISKGNNLKAIEILESIKLDSPFKLYYMGKAKQDKYLLLRSYNEFIEKRSDYFFSRLPLTELQKMSP